MDFKEDLKEWLIQFIDNTPQAIDKMFEDAGMMGLDQFVHYLNYKVNKIYEQGTIAGQRKVPLTLNKPDEQMIALMFQFTKAEKAFNKAHSAVQKMERNKPFKFNADQLPTMGNLKDQMEALIRRQRGEKAVPIEPAKKITRLDRIKTFFNKLLRRKKKVVPQSATAAVMLDPINHQAHVELHAQIQAQRNLIDQNMRLMGQQSILIPHGLDLQNTFANPGIIQYSNPMPQFLIRPGGSMTIDGATGRCTVTPASEDEGD